MSHVDRRITPVREDLAAEHLRDVLDAPRYVSSTAYQVSAGVAAMRREAIGDAEMVTQALHGEVFEVYEEFEGWAWGQLRVDGYVGYVEMDALSAPVIAPSHRVCALRTYVFSQAKVKSAPHFLISRNGEVSTTGEVQNGFARLSRGGWVYADHLCALDHAADDWVAVAESFLGAPYLWGGRESLGCDCSGLVQSALHAGGFACPRDADMQERALGGAIDHDTARLARGDIVFWKGHVGVMLDPERLLHANAHHMCVAVEPLAQARDRIAKVAGPISSIKRL